MMYQSFSIDAGTDPIVLSVTGGTRPNIAGVAFDNVPEPSSAALLGIASLAAALRRQRK